MSEADYEKGNRAAWASMLRLCLRELNADHPLSELGRLVVERAEAVARLRELCEEHGDNDWPDDLHLGDVIEKHLRRHLDSGRADDRRGR